MSQRFALFVAVLGVTLATSTVHAFAAKIDPRLATIKTAYITAVDELSDDRPAAACFKEHLAAHLPIAAVDSRESADIVLLISAHNPPYGARWVGKGPEAHIEAILSDGKSIWTGRVRPKGYGVPDACKFADQLLDELRDAMRKARGK